MFSNFRYSLSSKNNIDKQTRRFKFFNSKNINSSPTFDQYSAHSPIQISRHGVEELRPKIFFNHPPIPNRIAKFSILFCLIMTFSTGVRDKIRRRNKRYVREQERKLFRVILPFIQAMEDVRFTALDMKNYMVIKALSDNLNPAFFPYIRQRFHQEDI
jgi:hypothetical protein